MSYFIRSLALGLVLASSIQPAQAAWWGKKQQPDDITADTIKEFEKTPPTPENTVLVFDNHGVLTRFSIRAAFSASWKLFRNGGVFEDIWHTASNCLRKNKQEKKLGNFFHFVGRVKRYFWDKEGNDQTFETFVLQERNDLPDYIKVLNPHVPNPDTVELIKSLKNRGYKVFGCSNIGPASLRYMKVEFKDTFDHIPDWRTVSEKTGFRKKKDPDAKAFEQTKELIDSTLPPEKNIEYMRVLMVDDNPKNLKEAKRQAGFWGILPNKKNIMFLLETFKPAGPVKE